MICVSQCWKYLLNVSYILLFLMIYLGRHEYSQECSLDEINSLREEQGKGASEFLYPRFVAVISPEAQVSLQYFLFLLPSEFSILQYLCYSSKKTTWECLNACHLPGLHFFKVIKVTDIKKIRY